MRAPHPRAAYDPRVLHLRLITPADRTDEVVALLERTVGTAHLVVLAGAARDPAGDVVLCDVAREAADGIVTELRAQGIDRCGAISLQDTALTLSLRAEEAEREAPGDSADAVVWDELVEATQEESTLSATYLAFLAIATMIAACGVVLDNAVLVVGAMAVGPEFGPLAGLCTAIVRRAPALALRSLVALVVGFAAAVALTVAFSFLMDALGLFTEARVEAARPNTRFIYDPDLFSFVVALLAGIAGILSLTSAKSGALVGVAISVTTVPAAANAAVAFAYADYLQARGSAEQLLLNLLGLTLSGTATLLVQRLVRRRAAPRG